MTAKLIELAAAVAAHCEPPPKPAKPEREFPYPLPYASSHHHRSDWKALMLNLRQAVAAAAAPSKRAIECARKAGRKAVTHG